MRDRLIHSRFLDVSRPSGAGSNVTLLAGGMRAVKLGGNLPPGWCGNLMTSLSRAGISVMSLLPEQISLETWEGRALDCFHLKEAGGGPPRAATARELAAMLEALRLPHPRASRTGEGAAAAI